MKPDKPASASKLMNAASRERILLPYLRQFVYSEHLKVTHKQQSRKHGVVVDAGMTIRCMKQRIAEFNHGDEAFKDDELMHPSSVGGCRRSWWFSAFNAPRDTRDSPADLLRSHLVFEIGSYFHILFQNLCERAGILKSREVAIHDRRNKILGHADGIVELAGLEYILEIKSANTRNFCLTATTPKYEHTLQLTAYMLSLGIPRGIIIYYNKDSSDLREFVVTLDPNRVREVKTRINEHFQAVRDRKLPDRDFHDPNRAPCSYCPYLKVCYSQPDLNKLLKSLPIFKTISFKSCNSKSGKKA